MPLLATLPETRASLLLMGDEAVAQGAIDAGISAAYAYPGTPSTEAFVYLMARSEASALVASWCANEKTAYEEALAILDGRLGIETNTKQPLGPGKTIADFHQANVSPVTAPAG